MRHQQLQQYLSRTTARRVRLRLTDDRRSLLVARQEPDALGVTLHGMFLDAPTRVLRVLAQFLQTPRPQLKRQVIRLYRQTGLDRPGSSTGVARVTLRHKGDFFDLKEVYDRLNEEYFGGQLQVFITWGRRTGQPGRRSIHFGSYNWERRLIRVNPVLDRFYVPRYFLEYIVYHEMLHAALGVRRDGRGRQIPHSPEFQRKEKAFRQFARAREWERRSLHHFLRS